MNIKEKKDRRIEWRRSKVQELSSQGPDQREIAQILQVSNGTVNRDLAYLRQQAKTNIRKYIDERLPEKYECLVGFTTMLTEKFKKYLLANSSYGRRICQFRQTSFFY